MFLRPSRRGVAFDGLFLFRAGVRDMGRDFIVKWIIIGVTIATSAALIVRLGLEFPAADAWSPLAIAAALAAAAWFYHLRKVENFVAALTALMFLTSYTACYSVMMYAGAAIGRPLIDDSLVRFDAACGIHLPHVIQWAESHPGIERALQWSYNSLLWQTPLVIVVLGFSGELKPLRQFILQFMVGTWICALFFFALPAAGPFAAYGFEMNATQARYLQHLQELREGARTVVTWRNAEGLITFPSFHTAWALLLAWAVRGRKWLLLPSVLLNGAVITATMTTGWHYFSDVLAGGAVGVVTIGLIHLLWPVLRADRKNWDTQIELRLSELGRPYTPPRRGTVETSTRDAADPEAAVLEAAGLLTE